MADTKISGMTAKTTPVAADIVPILDSAASNANKRTTVGGIVSAALSGATTSYGAGPNYRYTFSIPDTSDADAKFSEAVPWTIDCGYSEFAGQTYSDPVMCVGYNVDFATGKKDTNEPGVGYFIEADYWDAGISARTAELYCQYLETASTAQIRPWFYQINRTTNRIVTAHIQIPVTNPLNFNVSDGTTTGAGPVFSITSNAADLYSNGSGDAVFQIRGNSSGSRRGIFRIGYAATNNAFEINTGDATTADFYIQAARGMRMFKSGGTGIKTSINGTDVDGVLSINAANTDTWSRIIWGRQQASASAYAVEFEDSAGTTRWAIDKDWNTELGQLSALATNATNGFPYIPTMAGAPSGTPTAKTGLAPIVVDTTNNRIYTYAGGAWRYAALT